MTNTMGSHLFAIEFNSKISLAEAYKRGERFVVSVGQEEYRSYFQSKAVLKQRKHRGFIHCRHFYSCKGWPILKHAQLSSVF